ncbi:enoyl-CoA hydratase/isomerase family protein [Saccharopolyspora sp. NPDC000995]
MTERVRVERDRGVLVIVLADGGRGNAVDLGLATELRDAAVAVDAEDVRCVLVRAEGKNFCVGGDLHDFAGRGGGTASHLRAVATTAHEAVAALAQAPVPVITAVQGAAAGAGVRLALTGDLVLAAESAKFRLAYTAIGLSPDCGGSWFLPRLIGARRAMDLALTNRTVSAREALDWGLVSRLVEPNLLQATARELAAEVAAGDAAAFAETKRLIRSAAETGLLDHLAEEARTIATLAASPDTQAAMQAFVTR